MPIEHSMLTVLGVLLALASVWDATQHRIPNALVAAIAATGAFVPLLHGDAAGVGSSALAVVIVAALVWPAWTRSWVGGADLKLAAAAAAWLGIARVPFYLVSSALAVGAVAAVSFAFSSRAVRGEVRRNLVLAAHALPVAAPIAARPGRVQVPAGVGFAIGALVTVFAGGAP